MRKTTLVTLLLVVSILMSACGEVLYSPEDAAQMSNGKTTVMASDVNIFDHVQKLVSCDQPVDEFFSDELEGEVVLCKPAENVDVVDMAALAAFATPWPFDEEIVGAVWVGKEIVKVIIVAGAAVAAGEVINISLIARHSDPSHNPNFKDTDARSQITALLTSWSALLANSANGNGPRCGSIRGPAGEIVRLIIVVADATLGNMAGANGYVFVLDPNNQRPWVTSYGERNPATKLDRWQLSDQQKKLGRSYNSNEPCPNDLPPLQTAQ